MLEPYADENKLPSYAKVCNCARCNRLLLGKEMEEWLKARAIANGTKKNKLPPLIFGRINGRPYCAWCYRCLKDPPIQKDVL